MRFQAKSNSQPDKSNQVRKGKGEREAEMRGIAFAAILGVLLAGIPSHSFCEGGSGPAGLIKEAKAYISEGNKEKELSALEAAF